MFRVVFNVDGFCGVDAGQRVWDLGFTALGRLRPGAVGLH